MWLLTVAAWSATKTGSVASEFTNVSEITEAWFSQTHTLNEGLRLLNDRRDAFNQHNGPVPGRREVGMVIEYRLLSAVEIPNHTDVFLLDRLRVKEIMPVGFKHANADTY